MEAACGSVRRRRIADGDLRRPAGAVLHVTWAALAGRGIDRHDAGALPFEHVLELLRQASFDPSVLAIKINIYRVAKDSRIIDSMIHAAHNGKKVTVVVELQARFDEEANIHWAKRLTEGTRWFLL